MSAIVLILHRHAAHLLTDGAGYSGDGRLQHIAAKAWSIPHLPAVIATRGAGLALPLLAHHFAALASFADLRRHAGDMLRTVRDRYRGIIDQADTGAAVQVVVAGMDDDRPSAFFVATDDSPAGRAFEVVPAGPVAVMPATAEMLADLRPIMIRPSAEEIDPAVDGLAIMCAQRRHRDSVVGHPRQPPAHLVGVHCQLTTITADGIIRSRILRRWPDKIGEEIRP
jgi:hypothetical protein